MVQVPTEGNLMLRSVRIALLALLASASMATAQGVVSVPTKDNAMAVAIAQAQASLQQFWDIQAKADPANSDYAVKIRYATRNSDGEHIWANAVVRAGNNVSATINNQPRDIPKLRKGQRVTVPISRVTDWMYIRDGKIQGGQTIRALLPLLPPDQAAELKGRLAPE
jgi:uncharacterized protein YegJ (DUF2314 family)